MKRNGSFIVIAIVAIGCAFFIGCSTLMDVLGGSASDSALFCVLPANIAQKLAPKGLDGGDLDNVDDSSDDSSGTNEGLNSATFMAGILATTASQGTELFNAIINELKDVKNLMKDDMFLTYNKDGKTYGVNIANRSKTCHITYGEVSSKSDKDFSKGDALTKFVYDPREQGKGPNMSILMDEYSLKNKSKSNGSRYLMLDIKNNSSTQTVGVKAFVEGNEAKFFKAAGGEIRLNKSTKLYEIEGLIQGHPIVKNSSLNPKFRVFGVMDSSNNGAISSKLEDFGLKYTVSKTDLLKVVGINDPIKMINPKYDLIASLDYNVRNYVSGSNLKNLNVKGTFLQLTKARVSADSVKSRSSKTMANALLKYLPSKEMDFTNFLAPKLKMGPPSNERSFKFYSDITENGSWKSYSISDDSIPTKSDFSDIYD